jgi:hypothetical protein
MFPAPISFLNDELKAELGMKTDKAPKKNGNEESNMVSKADFKNPFQSSLKEMLSKKEEQKNDNSNMEVDDKSLDECF